MKNKKDILWEDLVVLKRWITIDDMEMIKYDYEKGSVGYQEADMIIKKWVELCRIEELLDREEKVV